MKFCQFKTRPKAGLSFDHRPQASSNGRAAPVAQPSVGYGVDWETNSEIFARGRDAENRTRTTPVAIPPSAGCYGASTHLYPVVIFVMVGLLGIEPRLHPPHGRVLLHPVKYYLPVVGIPGIEPGLHAPHARVLPLYYIPYKGKYLTGQAIFTP